MTSVRDLLPELERSNVSSVTLGGGECVKVLGQGDVTVMSSLRPIVLKGVLLVEGLAFNLLSVPSMVSRGASVRIDGDCGHVIADGVTYVEAHLHDGLYQATLVPSNSI